MKLGFVELLARSAQVLENEAKTLKRGFASPSTGRWPKDFASEKADYDEMVTLAKQLHKAAEYHRPNPLGGPARVFDACADAIRAGDSVKSAMSHYGLRWALKQRQRKSSAEESGRA